MGALNRGFRRFVGIAAVSVALSAPQVAQSETLADALVGAYTHSGLLNQNRASNGLALTASLIGELLLYDFGTSKFRIEAAKETVLATREVLRSLEQRVLLRAVTAYMGVVEANEFVALRAVGAGPQRSGGGSGGCAARRRGISQRCGPQARSPCHAAPCAKGGQRCPVGQGPCRAAPSRHAGCPASGCCR